ncbi:MAG: S-layer protein domain-containing protein [Candidatus Methanoperedens sp.]|nr:S-layer protein domain-containing protein [Candidatus Methanoperedens sp.]
MSENLKIVNISSRTIDKDKLLYDASVRAVQFKVNSEKNLNVENGLNAALVKDAVDATDGAGNVTGGGYYAKVGWQAEKYAALNGKGNKLAKLVYEQTTTDKKTLTIGDVWDIGDGYRLTAQSIDTTTSPRQAWLALSKDGVKLDDKIIVHGQVYTYTKASLANETDVPIFVTYVDSVFSGATTDFIQLKYTWAVSTTVTEIKTGDKYGVMEVIEDGSIGTIKLRNTDSSVSLSQNSVVDVMGNLKFIVADNASVLRFYPMVGLPPMDRFELRGNVFDDSSPTMTWNALNFPGFWYDLNTNISTEELSFLGFSGDSSIDKEKIVYSTHTVKLTSKNPEISEYYMIGWQGEKFAPLYSYNTSSNTVDLPVCTPVCSISISRWFLDDRWKSLNESETWNLGNGYTLTPTGINGNAVTLSLRQNGFEVYRTIISPGTSADVGTHTMLYNTSISGINNVPIFSAYVNISGAKVEINHAYLLSDNPVKISLGDEISLFTVDQIDPIVLKNNIGVSLSQGSLIDLLGNIGFKVTDSNSIRFYPFTSKSLNISPPSVEILSPPDNTTIMQGEMMVLSGSARGSPDPYNYSWTSNIDGFLGNEKRILTFSLSPGTHRITMSVKDANGLTNTANSTITVTPVVTKNISGEPNVLGWNALNFPGFWYDKNVGEQTEKLQINALNNETRTIDKENLWYNTTMVPMKFMVSSEKNLNVEYGLNDSEGYYSIPSGGKYYNVTGWFGRKYVAINGKNNKLSKLLFEQTAVDEKTLTIGETWDLGEGWSLTANSIDAKTSPIYVWLELSKNGVKKDNKVSWEGGVYTYFENDIGREGNVPIFVTYIDNITASPTTDSVRLKYTWLISENIMEIRPGDKIGLLMVDMTYPLLKLKNENSITLAQGSTINIADGLRFRINNTSDLQYYPEMTVITGVLNQPPSDLTININNGASYTNSTSVTLSVSAINAQKMSFSNDRTTWSLWENYATTRSWTLTTGNGPRSVYFKTWNILGESSPKSESIVLDMEKPAVNITGPLNNNNIRFIDNMVRGEVIDDNIYSAKLTIKNEAHVIVKKYDLIVSNNKFLERVEYASDQNNTLELNALDKAGNTNTTYIQVYVNNNVNQTKLDVNSSVPVKIDAINETDTEIEFISNINQTNVTITITAITNGTEINNLNSSAFASSSQLAVGKIVEVNLTGLDASNVSEVQSVLIRMYYNTADLDLNGDDLIGSGDLNEDNMFIYWLNTTDNNWTKLLTNNPNWVIDSGRVKISGDNPGNVWVKVNHLSTFGLAAGLVPQPSGGGGNIYTSSGGGGGGGGGGASGENYSNIELKEKYEESIYKDKPTSYRFKNASNPVTFVNITGNVNAGSINTAVEVLKGTSTLVKEAAPGTVYKNFNIWVGTSGFATSNNIKEAIVVFRVENSWFDSNAIARGDTKLVRWDGAKWITLETSEKTRDSTYTYFEGKTISFSPFAITGLKSASVSSTSPSDATPSQTTQAGTPEAAATTGGTTPQINLFLIIGVIVILGIISAVYLKYKK